MLILRVLAANVAMALVLMQLHRATEWWLSASLGDRIGWLSLSVTAGAATYFLVLVVLGLRPSQFRLRHD